MKVREKTEEILTSTKDADNTFRMYRRHVNRSHLQVELINMLMEQVRSEAAIKMTPIITDVKMNLQPTWNLQARTAIYWTNGYHGIEWVCYTTRTHWKKQEESNICRTNLPMFIMDTIILEENKEDRTAVLCILHYMVRRILMGLLQFE